MPRVDFYHDADNKFAVAARLAQKSTLAGLRLAISAPDPDVAQQIDRLLWTFAPQSFVAHALEDSPLANDSPVVILQNKPGNATLPFKILINLDRDLPPCIEGYERVIEIVGHDEHDKAFARQRYKAYRELGCELVAHRLGQTE